MKKFSKEQAIVITGFTGKLACQFSDFHSDVEKRLGHPVWTHQFGDKEFAKKVAELYHKDFLAMIGVEE
jgi:hypothetical protein